MHGAGVIWMVFMASVNWVAAYFFAGKRFYPLFAWTGNLSFLILAEYHKGFKFRKILEALAPLDPYTGEMKWHHVSNLRMLNIISFCIDWHWSR
jgi:hypothetical protein